MEHIENISAAILELLRCLTALRLPYVVCIQCGLYYKKPYHFKLCAFPPTAPGLTVNLLLRGTGSIYKQLDLYTSKTITWLAFVVN